MVVGWSGWWGPSEKASAQVRGDQRDVVKTIRTRERSISHDKNTPRRPQSVSLTSLAPVRAQRHFAQKDRYPTLEIALPVSTAAKQSPGRNKPPALQRPTHSRRLRWAFFPMRRCRPRTNVHE